ncbi:hypothetical protein E4U53_001533, partial [Claviceps sorghi]
ALRAGSGCRDFPPATEAPSRRMKAVPQAFKLRALIHVGLSTLRAYGASSASKASKCIQGIQVHPRHPGHPRHPRHPIQLPLNAASCAKEQQHDVTNHGTARPKVAHSRLQLQAD